MQKRFVIRRFVHAAVQLTTSLAERVRTINGDGAPFRCPQDIILKSPPPVFAARHSVFAAFECKTSIVGRNNLKKMFWGPTGFELQLQA